MRIRTQLIVALVLLAVLPLTGIVLYSYVSSLRALRKATETEARTLAREMDGRMASLRGELGRGVERIGGVSATALMEAARSSRSGQADPLLGKMVLGFGDAAPLVKSLEFIPAAPPEAPVAPAPPPQGPLPRHHAVVIDMAEVFKQLERGSRDMPPEARASYEAAIRKAAEEHVHEREIHEMTVTMRSEAASNAEPGTPEPVPMRGDFEVPLWDGGHVVGRLKASIRGDEVLRRVLERTRVGDGEIPFAVDAAGKLHTVRDADRAKLDKLPIELAPAAHKSAGSARWILNEWVLATSKDPATGVVFGIARPVPLEEVRKAAARNFGYGLGMIGLALLGILPLTNRMTRNLKLVTDGAGRISQGDLDTRIPVRSRNELGALAMTFNRMAEDLKRHQEREIEAAVLRTEYDRKSRELEDARDFQLSLLPKNLPEHPAFEIAVSMRTATEVGGDYYDFRLLDSGALTAAVGDATGHGVRAGAMVTAVKSLFSADAGASGPRQFLTEAARAVKRMALDRMSMGLCLARLDGTALTVSSAGMPPVLVYRARTGKAEEIALSGMPLGGLAFDYEERRLEIAPGDTVLLMTDGLPELTDPAGEPLGYPRVRTLFEEMGAQAPEEVIAGLTRAADSWAAGQAAKDDMTFVVVRVRG
ncbi:MAG: PP2C family protein-serine/threonine phosphatase [Thermoanaerobaculia bacterium]